MRSTLFHIPHADPWLQLPLFGLGWLLLMACVVGTMWVIWSARKQGWTAVLAGQVPVLLVIGAAIVWVLPRLEEVTPDGLILGLPIRGYGVMVMLGVVAGVGLVVRLGQRMGVDPDVFFSLAFWIFLAGIAGARLFYVIEYWSDFQRPTWGATVAEVLTFTQGGLVVYGAFIGAVIVGAVFLWRQRLPILALADMVAPGMMLGLALGRLGCLLHGCCWGAVADESPIGITFPAGSPPYVDQLERGTLVGLQLVPDPNGESFRVADVVPDSLADQQGLEAGDAIIAVQLPTWDEFRRYRRQPEPMIGRVLYTTADLRRISWDLDELPPRSRPVYPAQILSAVNAILICWFLWLYYPFRVRDGAVLAWLLTIYPVTRFLLEMIRSDESSILQISFKITISQAISGIVLVLAAVLWLLILSRPRRWAYTEATTGSQGQAVGES